MKTRIRHITDLPMFPFLPFVPLALFGGLLALSTITLLKVRRLSRAMDERRSPEPTLQPAV
jgi:hypothetical protein